MGNYHAWDCDCHQSFACPNGEPSMPPSLAEFLVPQKANLDSPEILVSPTLPMRHSWEGSVWEPFTDWRDNDFPINKGGEEQEAGGEGE